MKRGISFFISCFITLSIHAEGKWLANIVDCQDIGANQKNMIGTPTGAMRVTRKNNLSAAEKLEYKKHGIKPDDFYTKEETYFSLGINGLNQGNFPNRWIANGTGRPEKCTDLFVTPLKEEITKKNPLLNMEDSEFKTAYEQANNGNAQQQYNLAAIYANGKKVQKNIQEYKKWLLKSAQGGYSQAQYVLGLEYRGDFSYGQTFEWHLKAAMQGHTDAQVSVAGSYLQGVGTQANSYEAINWYEKAAANNNATAMFMLGNIYERDSVIKPDLIRAKDWYRRAANLGHEDAKRFLAGLESKSNGTDSSTTQTKQRDVPVTTGATNQASTSLPREPSTDDGKAALTKLSGYDGFGLFCRNGQTFSALLTKKEKGNWVLRKTPLKESCTVDGSKEFIFEAVHE